MSLAARKTETLLWSGALLWVLSLVALVALFRLLGERAWPVVLLLYLPRFPLVLPGLVLLPLALCRGRRALLVPLGVAFALWLFPLMGLALPGPARRPAGPVLRLLSYNTGHLVDGPENIRALVLRTQADVVLLQWTSHLAEEALGGPQFAGWTVRRVAQFTVASRFPVLSLEAAGLPSGSGPPCAHAVLETPLGALDVFDIRPQSAREELGAGRHLGLRQRLHLFLQEARSGRLAQSAKFREAQARSIAAAVATARHPVVVAGDTNLPGGSQFLVRYFGGLRDAFAEAGWGFGFTHPARLPWMRLDRVLLGDGLQAVSFEVLPRGASAHRPVLAALSLAASPGKDLVKRASPASH